MSQGLFGVDLTPLRVSSEYRRLYVAGFISMLGGQATYVAVPYQLKQLTHSTLAVGSIGLAELVPLIVFGLYGGVLADRLNRRRLIISMEQVLMLSTVMLFVNALLAHPLTWILYADAAVVAAASSLQNPSVSALKQIFVAHDLQRAASTLSNVSFTTASIIGPALGGLAAVSFGPDSVYFANIVTFTFSLILLFSLKTPPTPPSATEGDLAALRTGLKYARSRPDIVGTYVVDLLAMVLAFPVVMLPFVAARFHEPYALSILYCGLPVGALVATLTSRWTRRVHRYGRAIVAAAMLWGLGITLFGYSSTLWLVLLGLAVGGGADAVSGIFRNTMWNESIPPEVRGRMAGIEMISYSLGPTAGQFRAGVMAAWTTLRFSLTFGGLACTGSVGVVAAALPSLWRFDARTDPHVAQVRALRVLDEAS
ncbi:MAG TPA: MFS transporter [Acidimicrobiales bacterium]|nr:MFS transporter [Acidimicrobiales bacterium]